MIYVASKKHRNIPPRYTELHQSKVCRGEISAFTDLRVFIVVYSRLVAVFLICYIFINFSPQELLGARRAACYRDPFFIHTYSDIEAPFLMQAVTGDINQQHITISGGLKHNFEKY